MNNLWAEPMILESIHDWKYPTPTSVVQYNAQQKNYKYVN